ncbi:hypothetical protein CLV24_101156 [Pontibacter ummariensis]|uniref:Uncharacterized protein n=2 Tax=Pontibacter ummariensis TaxID=1610492 RepID=A0A239B6Q9_9BACT|nr:hypothetical protein CLV24_101156 [Pontibacter ummariensis]SNS02958.1 hypothetical protein SAMN06296052_101156 [Pontibacter ummariensis]
MLTTILLVTSLMLYFFLKVITTPPKPEPDSYTENDDEPDRQSPSR